MTARAFAIARECKELRGSANIWPACRSSAIGRQSAPGRDFVQEATPMSLNRRRFVGTSAALAGLGAASRAGAQGGSGGNQPLDSVKIVTGFPPGGTSDTLCRRVAENLRGSTYTKSALVENKPGAGGQIAVQAMKGAPTDGSVILQTPASMLMIYPHIYKNLAYNAFSDVTAVTLACTFDFGFCVGPAVSDSIKDIPGFLAWCKANPDNANSGSP